ncbi:O-antigen polymerase [Bifidobacterium cebidarum]|uniref:Polymerase n=1 Tax=Bifidobacterium cebidarum TaxID=2650773 RepID=A0A6I1GE90_9BIFI|nr:O-antigen polymerase [Bifidobacterium cebidarum]KAB7788106.1 polymerase [Bifidobacterium cebidarum]
MPILCILINIVILSIFFHKKNIVNPLVIFVGLWTIIIFLSYCKYYNLIAASDKSYIAIETGVIGFVFGYFIYQKIFIPKAYSIPTSINYIIVYFFFIVSIYSLVKDCTNTFSLISSGGDLSEIRSMAQDTSSILYSSRSNLDNAIKLYFVNPFIIFFPIIFSYEYWNNGVRKKVFLIFLILLSSLKVLSDGSRSIILYSIFHFIFIGFLLNKQKIQDKIREIKNTVNSKLLIVVAVFLLIIASISRLGDQSFIQNIYYYFAMEPRMLDYWMTVVDNNNSPGFGLASINGIIFPLIYLIKNIFSINYPSYWYQNVFLNINDTDKIWIDITNDHTTANAYVTVFWFPYLDGFYFGIIFILMILGICSASLHKKVNIYNNTVCAKETVLYSLFMQGIIMSFVRLQFADTSYALAFVYIIFLVFYKNKNKSINIL